MSPGTEHGLPSPVTIAGVDFDNRAYDGDSDTAYYFIGDRPVAAAYSVESLEGHLIRYSEEDEIIGVTLFHAKGLLAEHGKIVVTI